MGDANRQGMGEGGVATVTPQPQKLSKQSGSITSPPSAPGGGFAGGAPMTPQPQQEYYCGFKKDVCNLVRPRASTPKFAKDCMCNKYANCTDCQQHDTAIRKAERERVLEVVTQLYDAGFKDPLVTVECAIAYLKNPTVPGHPEKQSLLGEP